MASILEGRCSGKRANEQSSREEVTQEQNGEEVVVNGSGGSSQVSRIYNL
jgi:hypothetical protein